MPTTTTTEGNRCLKSVVRVAKNQIGTILPLLAAVLAFTIGLPLSKYDIHPNLLMWIELPGQLYLRGLIMLVLPIIVCCAINASASTDSKSQGKLGIAVISYSLVHNFIGSCLGVGFAVVFKLGQTSPEKLSSEAGKKLSSRITSQDAFADLIRNLVPDNLVAAAFRSTQTKYVDELQNRTVVSVRQLGTTGSPNIIGLLLLSVAMGLAANVVGKIAAPFLSFVTAVEKIMLKLLAWFMWSTVIGVFSLVLANLLKLDDPISAIYDLGFLILAMTIVFAIIVVICVPIPLVIATRRNPLQYVAGMLQPWLIAIAPPSSVAPYPAHLASAEKWKLDMSTVNFSLPLFILTVRNGSATFISMCCVMVSHLAGNDTSPSDYAVILLLTCFMMAAVPAMPSGSLVTIIIIMESVGLPSHFVGLLFVVEWLLDRMRTGINTISISAGIIFVDGICKSKREDQNNTPSSTDDVEAGKTENKDHDDDEDGVAGDKSDLIAKTGASE